MLARNAARKQRRQTARILAASFAQLNLPWLAPAQLRWQATQATSVSQTPRRPRRRSSSRTKPGTSQTRALATATDQYTPRSTSLYPPPGYSSAFRNTAQDKNIPWDSIHPTQPRLSDLRPYEEPIILNTSAHIPARTVKVAHGVQGTAIDLLQHLHTSLQVGRLERAEAIILRLADLCSHGSTELLHAHTLYLEDCQRRLALLGQGEQSKAALLAMQKWFEVEVRNKGVAVDGKLLVAMIRASIKALNGSQRDRTVRRYTEMAQQLGEEQYYEALESEDYEDNEFAILCRIVDAGEEAHQMTDAVPEHDFQEQDARAQYRRKDALPSDQIPEVLPTAQRGEGLANIKETLKYLTQNPSLPAESALDEQYEQALKRQREVEETAVDVAIDRWRKADEELRKIGIHTAMQSRPIGALMWQWYSALLPALQEELVECKKTLNNPGPTDHDRHHYGPYLELLPLEHIAANTILHVLSRMSAGKSYSWKDSESEVKLSHLTLGLARTIEQEARLYSTKGNTKSAKRFQGSRGLRNAKQALLRNAEAKRGNKRLSKTEQQRQALLAELEWPTDAKVKFGAFLIAKLIETAQLPVTREHPRTLEKVTQLQPAFLHRTIYERGKRLGVVCSNPALVEKMESEPLGSVIAKRMPMIVEPKPWKGWNDGGYLHYSNQILRLPIGDKGGKDYFIAANKKGDMTQIYAGLTALGAVPWQIHHGVFKVQLEAWNSGEAVANFAPLHPDLNTPKEPPASDIPARKAWLHEMRALENERAGLHSKRCFQNFQLEIARTMINETIYFPHNLDFRGRAYPIPPYLNHMGADNVRGLLVFAKGKELGPNGLRWLKIHLATIAGHDKASIAERIEFTMSHLDDIYDSVRNPLNGRRWWLQAEDAWQTLAACFELVEALDSPDPTKFVSHLPVQQDGTCNGLQHYAALGGDKIGAAQVNLVPGDRPADVYSAVAKAVEEEVRKDAAQGNPIAQKLDGRITRKCVKQPVMTNVYGVTWFGAKEQVRKQLLVLFPNETRKSGPTDLNHMSQYIATKIFKSLGEMFAGAQAIQTWLGVCADRISTCLTSHQVAELTKPSKMAGNADPKASGGASEKPEAAKVVKKASKKPKDPALEAAQHRNDGSWKGEETQGKTAKPLFKSTVIWTTPLRLPVVQPYRSMGARQVTTSLQRIQISEPRAWHPVSKRKQLQAFPPNFIHSLDATHMLLSALKCKELGMTFASIHDSFWTHACDVDQLSSTLRDAFIEMHQDNIVGRLREEFQTRYKGNMYLASVLATSAVGKKITALRKGRKEVVQSELAVEVERLRLLESTDPLERAKGEAMVTAGSILASEGDEASLAGSPAIERHQLGTILRSDEASVDAETVTLPSDPVPAELGDHDDALDSGIDTREQAIESDVEKQEKEVKPGMPRRKERVYHRKLFVWQPLTFPEVPPRGSFDVTKIRDSAYFFH